jgi:hypothetical protein
MACSGCLFFVAVLMVVMSIIGEFVLPSTIYTMIEEGLPIKSQSDAVKETEDVTVTRTTITLFNLTNAYEMQTVLPAPKPHLVPIEIPFTEREYMYDPVFDGETGNFRYSSYTSWTPDNPSDLNLQIVQINPVYAGVFFLLPVPSETVFYIGFSHEIMTQVEAAMVGFGTMAVPASGGACSSGITCGAMQFATGALTDAMLAPLTSTSISMVPQVAAMGVCVPVEIVRFMNEPSVGMYFPFASGGSIATALSPAGIDASLLTFSITPSQALNFLTTFKTNGPGAMLSALAQQWAAVSAAGAPYAASSVAAQLNGAYGSGTGGLNVFGTLCVGPQAPGGGCAGGATAELCGPTVTAYCPIVASAYAMYLNYYLGDTFLTGCKLVGTMQPDGTGSLNSGLFTRRTAQEIFHGYVDPIFAAVPPSALPPSSLPMEFGGILGRYSGAGATLAAYRTAFDIPQDGVTTGRLNQTEWTYEYNGGGSNLDDLYKIAKYEGGSREHTGWTDAGLPTPKPPTGEFYTIEGLRDQGTQPMTKKAPGAVEMYTSDMEGAKFSGGSSMSFFLSSIKREVTISCGSCEFQDVQGVKALKFASTDATLATTVAGVPTDASVCGGTASYMSATFGAGTAMAVMAKGTAPTCDWIMRDSGVVNLEFPREAPIGVTHAFLGKTSTAVRDAVSITAAGSSDELYYNDADHELALFFEPITGKAIAGYERLQLNMYVDKMMFDSGRHASLFTGSTDNGDKFLMPFMLLNRNPKLTSSQADGFKFLYFMYSIGFAMFVTGAVLAPMFCACGVCLLMKKPSTVAVKPAA